MADSKIGDSEAIEEGTDFFVAITPQKELYEKIWNVKESILKEHGNQKYLTDPPHLTMLVGKATDMKSFFDAAKKSFSEINFTNKFPKIEVVGNIEFPNDKVTKKTSLGLRLSNNCVEEMRTLQENILNSFLPFKHKEIISRYSGDISFSDEEKSSLRKYGFPFAGSIWIPHFSLGTLDPSVAEKVKAKTNIKDFTGTYTVEEISFYTLSGDVPKYFGGIRFEGLRQP